MGSMGATLAARAALLHVCRGEAAAAEREFAAALATDPHHLGALVGLGALLCERALNCSTPAELAALGYTAGGRHRLAGVLLGSVGGGIGAGNGGDAVGAWDGPAPAPGSGPLPAAAGEGGREERVSAKQIAIDGALKNLSNAVRIDARSHTAWHLLALVHRMLGNSDKAAEAMLLAL